MTLSDLMNLAPSWVLRAPQSAWTYQRVREGGGAPNTRGYEFDRLWAPYVEGSRIAIHLITAPASPGLAEPFWHPHATALGVLVMSDICGPLNTYNSYRLSVGTGPLVLESPLLDDAAIAEMRAGRGQVRRVATTEWRQAADIEHYASAQLYMMEAGAWHDILVTEGRVTTLCIFAPDGMEVGQTTVSQVLARTPVWKLWERVQSLMYAGRMKK